MSSIKAVGLGVRFPVQGVDAHSLKKHVARMVVGGRIGQSSRGGLVVTALQSVHLELGAGDRLGVIGPNGSGKTTLLRALAGVYKPDEGRIEVNGRVASLLDLGMGLDASATGYENIRLRGLVAGMSSSEIEARMDSIADFTGLGHYLAMPLKTYSAGMSARLAFAVVTSVDADILLMDEWVAVGDADFRQTAHGRLNEMVDRAGIAVLASHDTSLIRNYCNKVVKLNGGRISPVEPVDQLDRLLAA